MDYRVRICASGLYLFYTHIPLTHTLIRHTVFLHYTLQRLCIMYHVTLYHPPSGCCVVTWCAIHVIIGTWCVWRSTVLSPAVLHLCSVLSPSYCCSLFVIVFACSSFTHSILFILWPEPLYIYFIHFHLFRPLFFT